MTADEEVTRGGRGPYFYRPALGRLPWLAFFLLLVLRLDVLVDMRSEG